MTDKANNLFHPHTSRLSSDSVWPLRCADGMTFAQRKAEKLKKQEEANAAVRNPS